MADRSTLADFEDLVPPGTAHPRDWLYDLAERVNSAPAVETAIGAVRADPTEIEVAKVALMEWADEVPDLDPRKTALARHFLQWLLRPSLRISLGPDGLVPDDVAPPVWGAQTATIQSIVKKYGPSVARLDIEFSGNRFHLGTAWVVGSVGEDWVLLTAGHVVNDAIRAGWAAGRARVVLDFGCLAVESIKVLVATTPEQHPTLDIATVRLARATAPNLIPLPLDGGGPDPLVGHPAMVLGHPDFKGLDETYFATQIVGFDGVPGVMRAAPGRLRAPAGEIPLPYWQPSAAVGQFEPRWKSALAHDATTLGGNSGSPVFSLVTGRVVGMHVGGKIEEGNPWSLENYALPAWLLPADTILNAQQAGVTGVTPSVVPGNAEIPKT
jgi:hypothetical protein